LERVWNVRTREIARGARMFFVETGLPSPPGGWRRFPLAASGTPQPHPSQPIPTGEDPVSTRRATSVPFPKQPACQSPSQEANCFCGKGKHARREPRKALRTFPSRQLSLTERPGQNGLGFHNRSMGRGLRDSPLVRHRCQHLVTPGISILEKIILGSDPLVQSHSRIDLDDLELLSGLRSP